MTETGERPLDAEDGRRREREKMRKMTLGEHLEELRARLILAVLALALAAGAFLIAGSLPLRIAIWPYHFAWSMLAKDWMEELETAFRDGSLTPAQEESHRWIFGAKDPATGALAGGMRAEILAGRVEDGVLFGKGLRYQRKLAQLGPIEYFVVWMKVALIFGFVLSCPVVFYQMWRFVAAGLYRDEQRRITAFLPYSVLLFLAGVSFSYFVVLPFGLYFLTAFSPAELVQQNYTLSYYIGFFFTVTLAMGLVFQLPVLMVGLARFGIMSAKTMAAKRKIFILLAFIIGAVLTPPDPFTQTMMAVPMIGLFELGLFLARSAERRREAPAEGA